MIVMGFIGTVLKNLFSKPATTLYPYVKKEYPVATRGHIAITIEDCIFCGICEKKCPSDAIKVVRTDKSWEIQRFGCIQCGACVEACPKKCLAMKTAYTSPSITKNTDSFTQAAPPQQ